MKILVLGGTAWLGHETARAAVAAGHDVTCLARGTDIPAGAALVRADRDVDDALAPVRDTEWDAVIDVARQPGQVRRAVRDLAAVAGRFIFVSTGNVYAEQEQIGADENAARLAPLDGDSYESPDDYGAAKVAGEDAVLVGFGAGRSVIARAGLIGGPGDPSGRSTYWPWRFARPSNPGGGVLVPDAPELPVAVIDVRDLASWLVLCAETGAHGIFNAMGFPVPFPHHLEVARIATGQTRELVAVSEAWLAEHGVQEWSGPKSLPLWVTDRTWYGFNARSNARAIDAGLVLRPLGETLADALVWRLAQPADVPLAAGLTDAEERELLASLR